MDNLLSKNDEHGQREDDVIDPPANRDRLPDIATQLRMLESMLRKGEAYTGVEEPHGWTIVSFQGKYADVPEKDIYDAEDLYVLSARILWQ